MIPEKRDFLINEYSNLNDYVSNAWTISYAVLSGGVGLFGFLVAQVQENSAAAAHKATFYAVMLTLVPTILSLVLGQLTSAVYFFYFRMLEIAKEFEVNDVWHRWDYLVREARKQPRYALFGVSRYSASFPLAVVSYIGTIFTPFYLFIQFPGSVSFFFAVAMTPVNLWLIYKRLVPFSFYQRVEDDFGPR
ncbi:MAG: hypothetical protein ACREV3_14400 [Gammaproteobacteria bacterium]